MDVKIKARPFSAQPSKIGKDLPSSVFKAFRPTSAFSGLQKGNEVNNQDERPEDEKEEEEKPIHSVGCPRYKISKGPRLSTSGNIESNSLHPKPWGARDPSLIPCSCFASRNKDEIKFTRTSVSKSFSQKGPKSGTTLFDKKGHKEVLNLFDEFCNAVVKKRVKLTNDELQSLGQQMIAKLGTPTNIKKMTDSVKKHKEPEDEHKKLAVERSALVESGVKSIRDVKTMPEPGLRNVIGKFYQGRVNLITPTGENYSEEVLQATSIPTYLTTLDGIQPVFPQLTALQTSPTSEMGYQAVLVRNPSKPQNRTTNANIPFWRQ